MRVEWDPDKAQRNRQKHGIFFADAVSILEDPLAMTIRDPEARSEDRFVAMGADALGKVLVVVYTWRGSAARLISARRATRAERRQYEES